MAEAADKDALWALLRAGEISGAKSGQARLSVKAVPSARDNHISIEDAPEGGQKLRIRVTAPPDKGKANKAIIALLAKALGIAKSNITLERGEISRDKVFLIDI